jgi:hypothetical protein
MTIQSNYTIVQYTQHWTIEHGAYYRDVIVRTEDGTLHLWGIRDDLLPR